MEIKYVLGRGRTRDQREINIGKQGRLKDNFSVTKLRLTKP